MSGTWPWDNLGLEDSLPDYRNLMNRDEWGMDSGLLGLHIKGMITGKLLAILRN